MVACSYHVDLHPLIACAVSCRNKLKAFLEPFSADGRIVSTDDINDFWVSMRSE